MLTSCPSGRITVLPWQIVSVVLLLNVGYTVRFVVTTESHPPCCCQCNNISTGSVHILTIRKCENFSLTNKSVLRLRIIRIDRQHCQHSGITSWRCLVSNWIVSWLSYSLSIRQNIRFTLTNGSRNGIDDRRTDSQYRCYKRITTLELYAIAPDKSLQYSPPDCSARCGTTLTDRNIVGNCEHRIHTQVCCDNRITSMKCLKTYRVTSRRSYKRFLPAKYNCSPGKLMHCGWCNKLRW